MDNDKAEFVGCAIVAIPVILTLGFLGTVYEWLDYHLGFFANILGVVAILPIFWGVVWLWQAVVDRLKGND